MLMDVQPYMPCAIIGKYLLIPGSIIVVLSGEFK